MDPSSVAYKGWEINKLDNFWLSGTKAGAIFCTLKTLANI